MHTKPTFYRNARGDIFPQRSVEDAFHIMSGNNRSADETGYAAFLERLKQDRGLEEIFPTVEELVKERHSVYATTLYRAEHNCSLTEARNAVKAIEHELGFPEWF